MNSTQNTQFEQQIQQWVLIDNQIKIYSDKIRDLREKKQELCNSLTKQAEQKQIMNNTIQISDGKLKFTNTRVQGPLTFKYLEKTLGNIIKDDNQAKRILDYVKQQREVKVVSEIKRFYNN